MTNSTAAAADSEQAARLRRETVKELIRAEYLTEGPVAEAMRTVPREVFLPGVALDEVYSPYNAVVTKQDEHGNNVSSVSAPQAQAVMLQQAGIRPGQRVLEVGSGGYNAALIAELVGPTGQVTTVDIDEFVVDRARRFLPEAGYPQVNVVLADAEYGVPDHAPYDHVLVTAGAGDVPPAWINQLTDRGRIVVALRMLGLTRTVAFDHVGNHLESNSTRLFGFVPLRGVGEHINATWALRGGEVTLDFGDNAPSDLSLLNGVFDGERVETPTGARIGRTEPLADVQMWLATVLPGLCWVTVDKARDTGVVALTNRSTVLGAVDGATLAYLTTRATDDPGEVEWVVHAYGPRAAEFAAEAAAHLRTWAREHRGGPGPRITVHPAGTPDSDLPSGRVVNKRHSRVTISWPETATSGTDQDVLHHPTDS